MSERSAAALPTSIFSVLGHLFGQSPSSSVESSSHAKADDDQTSKMKKRRRSGGNNKEGGEVEEMTSSYGGVGGNILIDGVDESGGTPEEDDTSRQRKRLKEDNTVSATTDDNMEHDEEVLEGERTSILLCDPSSSRGRMLASTQHTTSQKHHRSHGPPPQHPPLNPHAVFVTGLSFSTVDPAGLIDLFSSRFGPVKEARVAVKDGKGRGFGYVLFAAPSSASECLRKCSTANVTTTTTTTITIETTMSSSEEAMKGEGDEVEIIKLDGRNLQVQACRRDLIDKWHAPALPQKPVLVKTATITTFKPRGVARVKVSESALNVTASSTNSSTPKVGGEIEGKVREKREDEKALEVKEEVMR